MLVEAVLAVGYDSQSYYVKNSWGTWWGEQGYIRMGRYPGDTGYGKCGILMQPSQPVACSLAGPGPAPAPSAESYSNPSKGCKDGEIAVTKRSEIFSTIVYFLPAQLLPHPTPPSLAVVGI